MISEIAFRDLFDLAADCMLVLGADGCIKEINHIGHEQLGYTRAEMVGQHISRFISSEFSSGIAARIAELLKQGNLTFESAQVRKDGSVLPVEISSRTIKLEGENAFFSVIRDISKRKQIETKLRESEEKYRALFEESYDGLFISSPSGKYIDINLKAIQMFGYDTKEEMLGLDLAKDIYADPADRKKIIASVNAHGFAEFEVVAKKKNGERITTLCSFTAVKDRSGAITAYRGIIRDITEKKRSEELIWRQANFDTLTGLPNRDMFRDRLGQAVKKSDREDLPLALLLIDLDQFKEVNDTLGHEVGDILLKEVAKRTRSCIRESDTLARLGGDEFTVVLPDVSVTGHIEDVAQKIIGRLAEPFQLGDEVVYISASIGITVYPNDADDIDALMKNADQAMYVAKGKGRNRYSYFTLSLQQVAQNRLRLINDLRGALKHSQFQVHFQPIIELTTGQIQKAEALIRWKHPERGMVSPADFIPLAEETGLINEIGNWVFREAARWAGSWDKLFKERCQISVNMSPVQFHLNVNMCDDWMKYLAELGLAGNSIVIEITEGLLLHAGAEVTDNLLKFRDAGIQVAIDDFGTGYSTLSYLKRFDIDYLKIDRSFVTNLEKDADNMALCEAIIVMSHKLGLKVIAEGVETEAQRSLLASAGCDFAQGYLFSKPVPPEQFEKLLKLNNGPHLNS
ncbi:cyclic di-GMP phosphodiesterase Gmr [mine drainage metagenome]|uniref:Cyclic di-GMP phosphodiesterase Gmr n=1 Tax=mine drainage metagenome TaxID=410659 RepID=A0A1J5RXZ8_9ZZZZ